MYICKDCGAVFEEPGIVYDDPSPAGVALPSGSYAYEECPDCGGDDFEEARHCDRCDEYYLGDKILCDSCMEELGIELREIKGRFHMTQDDFEQAICDYFGW